MVRVFFVLDDTKTAWSHCMIAVVFIACHAFVVVVIIWDQLLVLFSSDDCSDVLEPVSGI